MQFWTAYRRTFLALLVTSYPSIAQTTLSFFSCIDLLDDSRLSTHPSISCRTDTEYLAILPLFVLLLIIVLLIPLLLFIRLYQLNEGGGNGTLTSCTLFNDPTTRKIYGALTDAF